MVSISIAIFLAISCLLIVYFRTNGEVHRGHIAVLLISFMFLCQGTDWVPSELYWWNGNKMVTFRERVVRENNALKDEIATELAKRLKVAPDINDIKD